MKPVAVQYSDYINGDFNIMAMSPAFFNWFDTETTGLSASFDQIVQFAGIRTDADLNYVKDGEFNILVKPRLDVVPGPKAFAITGISMNELNAKGHTEFDAAAGIRGWLTEKKNSMQIGFNTLSFDDEVLRNMMFRTMQDPYKHEYDNQNSRGDLFRLLMFVYALRPDLINFHRDHEGVYRLTLGLTTAANGIVLENAHDARSDIVATIELARLIKQASPKLWDYYLNLCSANFVKPMIEERKPLVLVDRYLAREQGHMTLALPIIYDERSPKKMLCVDLRDDPTELMSLSAEELKRRIFTKSADLPEGQAIKSIRDMTTNKQPLIARPNILTGYDNVVSRSGLDLDACMRHAEMLSKDEAFKGRLLEAHRADFGPPGDAYETIYSGGFIGPAETKLRLEMRQPVGRGESDVALPALVNADPYAISLKLPERLRMYELSLRAKWANFGDEVLAQGNFTKLELKEWIDHLERVWFEEKTGKYLINIDGYKTSMDEVRSTMVLDERQQQALAEMDAHVITVQEKIQGLKVKLEEMELAEALANSVPVPEPVIEEENIAFIADLPIEERVAEVVRKHEESTLSI
jgi:exodeoxyribonuclease-1